MVGAFIAFVAGWTIRKFWPNGVLFLIGLSSISFFINYFTRSRSAERLGETFFPTFQDLTISFGMTLGIVTVFYLVGLGLSLVFSKKRKWERSQKEQNAKNS